jgi:hypothetical protein
MTLIVLSMQQMERARDNLVVLGWKETIKQLCKYYLSVQCLCVCMCVLCTYEFLISFISTFLPWHIKVLGMVRLTAGRRVNSLNDHLEASFQGSQVTGGSALPLLYSHAGNILHTNPQLYHQMNLPIYLNKGFSTTWKHFLGVNLQKSLAFYIPIMNKLRKNIWKQFHLQ